MLCLEYSALFMLHFSPIHNDCADSVDSQWFFLYYNSNVINVTFLFRRKKDEINAQNNRSAADDRHGAATAEDVWQYETYTSLGDSAVAGYGLPGWEEMKREYAVWGDEAVNMDVRDAIASLNSLQDAENALVEGTPEYAATFAVLKQQKLEELGDDLPNHWHAT